VANDYNVMIFQECPRCKEHEPDHAFTNCGFDVERRNNKTVQVFECTRCNHKWEIKHK
jgi:hypothetical protein